MGADTKIEWCHHTFNCWRGCTKVSPGCAHCYADTQSKRNPSTLGVWGPNGKRVVAAESAWREVLKWDRAAKEVGDRHRVFCASMADVFEDWTGPMMHSNGQILHDGKAWYADEVWVPREERIGKSVIRMSDVRSRLFWLIHETPNLDWLLLTKRPENVGKMVPQEWLKKTGIPVAGCTWKTEWVSHWPKNVWLGVSVEDQARADERIPLLLKTPAYIRFLSCEPLLGPLDLFSVDGSVSRRMSELNPRETGYPADGIDWVIVGGESGHGARPLNVAWVRSIVEQCEEAEIPVFVKQLGGNVVCRNDEVADWFDQCPHLDIRGKPEFQGQVEHVVGFRDRKGGDPTEWPQDLNVREFPKVTR